MRKSFWFALIVCTALPAWAQGEGEGEGEGEPAPAGWTCSATFYGDASCDCGCGVQDSDCADTAITTCEYNGCATDGEVPTAANTLVCAANVCGDGVVAGEAEACDDGDGPGCSADCTTVTEGYDCGYNFPGFALEPFAGCPPVVCGAGNLEGAEECEDDDGAAPQSGDGCSATCTLEEGFACGLPGEACHATVCGDGTIEGAEACEDDDGASPQSGDGCSATCTLEEGFSCPGPGEACVAVPADWACNPRYYGADDGCDCGCGALDADCSPGCAEPGCTDASCEFCYDAAGEMVDCAGAEGEGEGEGEDPPAEGEGEGEGEDGGRDDDDDPARDPPACSGTEVTGGVPASLALLGVVALRLRRRRR